MDNGHYLSEGSSFREPKVAIPRIRGKNYEKPPAIRTPRIRSEVVSKARPNALAIVPVAAQRKSHALAKLLIDVSSQLNNKSKKRVEDTLASFEDDTPPPPPTPTLSHSKRARRASSSYANDDALSATSADGGEAHVSASVGSNGDLDFIQEDILNADEAENTGYMGRISHDQWVRALKTKIEQTEGEPSDMPYGPPGTEGDAFNQRVEALLVHSPFPILGDMFEAQLQMFFTRDQGSPTFVVGPKWKAIMNLVFAIGARYSHLIGAEWRADDHDYLVYMWRAVYLLELQSISTLVAQPDQVLIQAFGLLSLYYLTIGHKAAQKEIASLSDELEAWALHSLSRGSTAATAASSEHDLSREQLLLYLYYHNAKICITRPCLCRLDLRIKGQSEESIRFNQKAAEACIGAALGITSILPDTPDTAWFYGNGPWWCAIHIIMQALTVLLFELSLDGIHLTIDKSHITSCVDKLIRWLGSMKSLDAVSERAYNIVARVLNKQSKQEAAHRQLPQPEPTDPYQQPHDAQDITLDSQQQYQPYSQPLKLLQAYVAWPSADPFNSNSFYPQSDTDNFYLNDVSRFDYLNDPNAGLIYFSQPLNLFYGNPYEANFDQWEWDPAASEDLGLGQQQGPSGGQNKY
ncbi:hypothetical protein Alg130_09996 [Pyrenophora tritici-repentis]|nr:hypothetical protein Alg130_09996 [Pyrenophora tritici-repentis]